MRKLTNGEFESVISIYGLAEIGGFISRNSNPKNAHEFILELLKLPNLYISYVMSFDDFMNSVLSVAIARGLSGSDAIHFISALSSLEVEEIITLDYDFDRVADAIKITNPLKR
ncbi:MAG: hypothetical protein COS08_01325 [Euryarchaeota archaeon CG01_land_8_20_14_3_00_38_12]|nr:MAG: hypothetical protein COS08_01325 [Euryarchaeota archaeon CG01_land_8_20_14_3_00_38_12]